MIIPIIFLSIKLKKEQNKKEEEYLEKLEEKYRYKIDELESRWRSKNWELEKKYDSNYTYYQSHIHELEAKKRELERENASRVAHNDEVLNIMSDKVRAIEKAEIEAAKARADNFYNAQLQVMKDALNEKKEEYNKIIEIMAEENEEANKTLENIKRELESFKKLREIVTENFLERKAEEEKDKAYRIVLTDENLADINFLLSISPKFRNPEVVGKLIWSEYILKPFNEMIKRQFGGKVPKNVIYCIRNEVNGMEYIGKTQQEISKRWTDHIKTSLLIGGKIPNAVHKAMRGHIEDFTFKVLERDIDPDELGDREKYYIDLLMTHKNGYNMKVG